MKSVTDKIDKITTDRYWTNVDVRKPTQCWPWLASLTRQGYGQLGMCSQQYLAHRVAYEISKGPIPVEHCVLHTCRRPDCCNPAHLFIGTRSDNIRKDRLALFWINIDIRKPDDCWPWQGCRNSKGYGQFGMNRQHYLAHRLSYTVHFGPIPSGLCVLHRCDNPICVNPAHLYAGTHKDNMRDKITKNRHWHGKLNEHDKEVIRNTHQQDPTKTSQEIATMFGVHRRTILKYWNREKTR